MYIPDCYIFICICVAVFNILLENSVVRTLFEKNLTRFIVISISKKSIQ